MAWKVLRCSWVCLIRHVVWAALRNGAHHWASWAFSECFSAAVGIHLCVCACVCMRVRVRAEAAGTAVAAADLTQSPSWHADRQRDKELGRSEGSERGAIVPIWISLYGHISQKWPSEISLLLQLWAKLGLGAPDDAPPSLSPLPPFPFPFSSPSGRVFMSWL